MKYFLPVAQIILSVGAAIVYFVSGDWKHGVYWLSASVLTSMVTLL